MKQDELAALILDELYERRDENGVPNFVSIAESRGITSLQAVGRAAKYLKQQGLLSNYAATLGQDYVGRINSFGVQLYERYGSGKSVVESFHQESSPGAGAHYHGPVFQGGIDRSNVAIASPGATQAITIGTEVPGLIDALISALKSDQTLPKEEQEEALDDAESLKDELGKSKPNSKVLKTLLSGLAIIAVAAEYVEKIKTALGY